MPEEIWADGSAVPVEREDAPELRHADGHDRHQAIAGHRRVRGRGGSRGRLPLALPLHRALLQSGEASGQKDLQPATDGAAAAPQGMGEGGD